MLLFEAFNYLFDFMLDDFFCKVSFALIHKSFFKHFNFQWRFFTFNNNPNVMIN